MLQSITVDAQTGEITARDLSPAEIAAMAPDPAAVLAAWRGEARCTRMQGILALGETRWAKVLEYRSTATWAEKVVIDDANDWRRTSQNIAFFAYLLGLGELEVDDLFRVAGGITA